MLTITTIYIYKLLIIILQAEKTAKKEIYANANSCSRMQRLLLKRISAVTFNMKNFLISLSLSLLFVTTTTFAETATNKPDDASIKKVFELTKTSEMLKSLEAQMDMLTKNMMQQALKGETISPEEQKILDNFRGKVVVLNRENMSWEKLQPLFVEIYAKTLSQDDINGMINFYQSAAGQSFINKMPLIMQETMGTVQKLMPPMLEKLKLANQEMLEELNKIKK